MKLAHHADRARQRPNLMSHLPEDAILTSAEFFEFGIWTIPDKMTQNVAAFAAIENEVQLGLGHCSSKRMDKRAPSIAMHGMTVDEDAIHSKDDAVQSLGTHDVSPDEILGVSASCPPLAGRAARAACSSRWSGGVASQPSPG